MKQESLQLIAGVFVGLAVAGVAAAISYFIARGMLFHQRSRSSDKSQANSPLGVLICNFEPPTRPNFATLISKIFPCARTLEA